MADIFISYAREDREIAEQLANLLVHEGWVVWWDRNLRPGADFSTEIERELHAARTVLVCWSVHGVKSSWVRDEAMLAKREGKLQTISLDGTEPPIGFMQYHAHDMAKWNGEPSHPAFIRLADEVQTTLSSSDSPKTHVHGGVAQPRPDPGVGSGWRGMAWAATFIVLIAVGSWWISRNFGESVDQVTPDSSTSTAAAEEARLQRSDIPPATNVVSMVVLPFESRSSDPDDQYFADGVSEQILNALSSVKGLQVVARTTAFSFRDRELSLREIAELLGVTHVLEGSVARSGDRVRVTAQLVDAEDGFNVWSNSYDRISEDLFVLQDEIARSVFTALPIDASASGSLTTVAGDVVIDAYDLFMLAREKLNRNTWENHEEITTLLDQALALSPGFIEALALRAIVEIMLSDYLFGARMKSMDEALPRAKHWIDEARDRDANAPEVLFALGLYHQAQFENSTAQAYYRDALEARPNFTFVRSFYASLLLNEGRGREAVSELKIALRYDPAHAGSNQTLFDQYILLDEVEKAGELLDDWEIVDPEQRSIAFYRARWLRFAGRIAESLLAVEARIEANPEMSMACSQLYAEVLLRLAEYTRVAREFESCDGGLAWTSRALTLQGRHKEAIRVASDWREAEPDSPWPIDALLRALYYSGNWSKYVETLERNFHNYPFFRDVKTQHVVWAAVGPYRHMGHDRLADLTSGLYEYIEEHEKGGATYPEIDLGIARVLVLDGREDEAMARLQQALAKTLYTPWIPIDPVLDQLSGREDYEALVSEIEKQVNAERGKLELTPVTLTRSMARINRTSIQN